MGVEPNAVELTVDHAWFIAETIGAGSFPWVLAITPPYCDAAQRDAFFARQKADLIRMGLLSGWRGRSTRRSPTGSEWCAFRTGGWTCATWGPTRPPAPASCCAASSPSVRCSTAKTVVALRSAQLITFTAIDVDDARALVPVLCVGLAQRPPARFDEFSMPTRVGARADERLRGRHAAPRSP